MKELMIPTHKEWLDKMNYLTLPNGLNMAYIEAGDPEKETLLMISGISDSSRNWRTVMLELEKKYHLYALDLRGFGKTDKPDAFLYTAAQFAEDVGQFMDCMGIEKTYLAGHSMGSMVAQTVAFSHPEKILGLILISTFARMHETPQDVLEVKKLYDGLNIPEMSDKELLEVFIPEPEILYDPEFVTGYLETVKGISGKIMRAAWYGMSINDNRNFLQFIKAPVLILWGSRDDIFKKEHQDEILGYLPQAKFITYEGISHDIITQDPLRAAKDIDIFIQTCFNRN